MKVLCQQQLAHSAETTHVYLPQEPPKHSINRFELTNLSIEVKDSCSLEI